MRARAGSPFHGTRSHPGTLRGCIADSASTLVPITQSGGGLSGNHCSLLSASLLESTGTISYHSSPWLLEQSWPGDSECERQNLESSPSLN